MLSLNVVVLLTVAAATAAAFNIPPDWDGKTMIADKDYLNKEKSILQLLWHVHQPLLRPELSDMAKNWNPEEHMDMFKDKEGLMTLMKWWKEGKMLKRGEVFSIFDKEHLQQSIHLFEMLYFAKDWDTMYKSAVWAREYLNEEMFVHVLALVIHQREDSHYLVLPPMYEIFPEKFISAEIMEKAFDARMMATEKMDKDIIVIASNFSDWMYKKMSPEKRLAYFTEDVTINENHLDWHVQIPWKTYTARYRTPICDQIPYYKYKQLLAKYKLERLSNNLEDLEMFKWEKKMEGYAPHLRYRNGKEMPMRPDDMKIRDTDDVEVEWVKNLELRMKVSIDKEYKDEKKDAVANSEIDLGKKSFGCYMDDIANKKEWKMERSLSWSFMNLIGRISDPKHTYDLAPSAMMHFETQRRDPLYYKVIARLEDLMVKEKESMMPYTKDDLLLPGVEIESMEFDKLITYFEPFDVMLNNAFDISSIEDARKKPTVMARLNRLNHMPFTFRMMVKSEKLVGVVIRLFMAPKTDSHGIELTLKEKAPLMFEMDRWFTDLKAGTNKIERNSKDMSLFEDDKLSFKSLHKRIEDALQDKAPFHLKGEKEVAAMASMPKNYMLPKGKKYGMSYTMHAVITPLPAGMDDKPLGYPFDRKVTEEDFKVPNIAEKEILIYHKKTMETHESH